jgi:integrase
MPPRAPRRAFGELERRRARDSSKTVGWRARYWGPDLKRHARTFGDRMAAEAWLAAEHKLIDRDEWTPPAQRQAAEKPLTLAEWAAQYFATRDLADSTRREYERVLRLYIGPSIGQKNLRDITVRDVATWHARLKSELAVKARREGRTNGNGSGQTSQAYKILSGILKGAVTQGLVVSSAARVEGGGRSRRRHEPVVVTPQEVRTLALALPENLRALADLLAWSGLRIGEAKALRRRDLDLRDPARATVTVAQNVTRGAAGREVIGRVKTDAGRRTVAIPAPLAVILAEHVEQFARPGPDGLIFPGRTGGILPEGTWRYAWIRARQAAGLPTVRTHDLRHTSLTMAARTGATTAELMLRAGHVDPRVAMGYQHAAAERDRLIADRMAAMMRGDGHGRAPDNDEGQGGSR